VSFYKVKINKKMKGMKMVNLAGNNKAIEKTIENALKKLTTYLNGKTQSIYKAPEDIAIEAILYAIKNNKIDWSNLNSAEKHIFYSGRISSTWIIQSEFRKMKNSLVDFTLNNKSSNDNGDEAKEHWSQIEYSYEKYCSDKKDGEFFNAGRQALNKLDDFLRQKGISERDIAIYKDRVLYNISSIDVRNKYNISASNLYKIVCIINAILSRDGRELLHAA
jgi:hypothetical protein